MPADLTTTFSVEFIETIAPIISTSEGTSYTESNFSPHYMYSLTGTQVYVETYEEHTYYMGLNYSHEAPLD